MSNNIFNEVQKTWFQMKPFNTGYYDNRCVFCHQGFSIGHVKYVSDVTTVATGLYTFTIELATDNWHKALTFEFERKVDVIKGHREFCRAYKKIEEFAYESILAEKTTEDATIRAASMGEGGDT